MYSKRRLASGISVIAIAAALTIASPAHAQAEFGTIQGHVDGAAPGTRVAAVDTHTGQQSVGTVNAQGNYEIFGLRPSTYSVSVAGKAPQTATVGVGQSVAIDFIEARAGAIVVTGRRTAQPVQAQTVATNITPAQIENLPQNSRNFLSFAALAPGITLANPSGATQFQAGALNADHANVLLDGMSFKNPINHGGMFGQNYGSFGNPFPEIAIQEYQVETQNFGAEVGRSASAVLSAITKTGGDTFHGSAFIDFQPKGFIGKPFYSNGPKANYNRKQFGGDFGGPIIPGKLSFYVAAEGVSQSLPSSTGNVTRPIPTNIATEINQAFPQSFHQGLYFGKLTWFASPDDTVNLMGYVRRQNQLSDFGGNAPPEHGRNLITHQTREQAQWKHSSGNFLNFLNIAHDVSSQATPAVSSGPEYILIQGTDTSVQDVLLGTNSYVQADNEKSWVIKDDATLRHGEHTFKFGGDATFYNLARTVNDHWNGTFFVTNPCSNVPAGGVCNVANFDIKTAPPVAGQINIAPTPTLAGKDTLIGLYAEDEWKPDMHWTVNAGLRWDFESNPNDIHYVTPPAIAAALRAYQGWAARGINPEDYISNGHNRHPQWDEFQPRLGVSYDVHGDHDLVFFGGIGRFYDESLFLESQIEQQTNSNIILNVPLPGCPGPAYCTDPAALRQYAAGLGFTGGAVWVLPNKLKATYSDQVDLGVRKQFGAIQASLTFSHVQTHNLFMYVRSNFFSNGWYTRYLTRDANGNVIGCTNGGDQWIQDNIPAENYPACPAMNGQLTGFHGKLDRGEDDGRATLDAIYLHVEKPFTDTSRWGFTESFTLQRARTNIAFNPWNQDEMYTGPEFGAYGWNNVPGGDNGASGVPKWASVTSATWRAPFGFILSGTLTLNSGPSFGHLIAPWNGTINPPENLCCYANFGGVFWPKQTIGYKRLDLRVAKTFKIGPTEVTADFQAFNVFNWLNRTYTSWGAGAGDHPPRTENGAIANDQRQFQAGLKFKF